MIIDEKQDCKFNPRFCLNLKPSWRTQALSGAMASKVTVFIIFTGSSGQARG